MKIGAVLLAAGASRRFGPEDKLCALYHDHPLVTYAAAALREAEFHHVMAIVHSRTVADILTPFSISSELVSEGPMAHRLGIGAQLADTSGWDALAIVLGDMPHITAAHLRALQQLANPDRPVVTVATPYKGPPAIFPRAWFERLQKIEGDQGARALFTKDVADYTVNPQVIHDIDRPEDMHGSMDKN